jgi:type I restriction enzyme, S subunit
MSVSMKDSGVGWLGKTPAHWDVVQSRRLFCERNEKAKPNDKQLTVSQKYGLVSQTQYMELEGRRIVVVQKGQDILKHTMPGDVVISMRSFQGGLELSELEGSVSSAYVPITPIKWVVPRYFRWLFKSITYIQALQATSDLVRDGQALRFENFAKVPLPVVPEDEQTAIADFLDRATYRIDTLVAKKTRFIELLRKKCEAMITHAVTKGVDACVAMKDSWVE